MSGAGDPNDRKKRLDKLLQLHRQVGQFQANSERLVQWEREMGDLLDRDVPGGQPPMLGGPDCLTRFGAVVQNFVQQVEQIEPRIMSALQQPAHETPARQGFNAEETSTVDTSFVDPESHGNRSPLSSSLSQSYAPIAPIFVAPLERRSNRPRIENPPTGDPKEMQLPPTTRPPSPDDRPEATTACPNQTPGRTEPHLPCSPTASVGRGPGPRPVPSTVLLKIGPYKKKPKVLHHHGGPIEKPLPKAQSKKKSVPQSVVSSNELFSMYRIPESELGEGGWNTPLVFWCPVCQTSDHKRIQCEVILEEFDIHALNSKDYDESKRKANYLSIKWTPRGD